MEGRAGAEREGGETRLASLLSDDGADRLVKVLVSEESVRFLVLEDGRYIVGSRSYLRLQKRWKCEGRREERKKERKTGKDKIRQDKTVKGNPDRPAVSAACCRRCSNLIKAQRGWL